MARRLAVERIALAEGCLPERARPAPLPDDADADALRQRHRNLLSQLDGVPELDALLFGAPADLLVDDFP